MKKINFFRVICRRENDVAKNVAEMWHSLHETRDSERIRRNGKKNGEVSLTSNLRNSGKKMVEHSGFEPLTLTLPV